MLLILLTLALAQPCAQHRDGQLFLENPLTFAKAGDDLNVSEPPSRSWPVP